MTTTLAPPHAVHPETPDATASAHRAAAAPRVTAVLLVRGDSLGRSTSGDDDDSGTPAGAATRVGRLPEVLDSVAAQTRPPERLVVVVADEPVDGTPLLATVTTLVEAHDRLVAAVSELVVIGSPAPVELGVAVDAALAEVDRRNAPGESVPAASAGVAAAEVPAEPEAPEAVAGPDESAEPAEPPSPPSPPSAESASPPSPMRPSRRARGARGARGA